MKSDFRFDSESKILYKIYEGPVTLEEIKTSWQEKIQSGSVPGDIRGIIVDYSNAGFQLQGDEYIGIAEFYRSHLEFFGNLKIGVVTSSAKDIIIPTLVEQRDRGYFSKPFSSIEAAKNWILL